MQQNNCTNEGQIDLINIIDIIAKQRKNIIVITSFVTIIGLIACFSISKVYESSSILFLKEPPKNQNASSIISQIGSVGNLVSSYFGMENPNLEKIDIILKSQDFARFVLKSDSTILPLLFPAKWDTATKKWKENIDPPDIQEGVEKLTRGRFKTKLENKSSTISLSVFADTPQFSQYLAQRYIYFLNLKLQQDIVNDARANRNYLEQQLNLMIDPLLKDKIQILLAQEIEREMLSNSNSLISIEPPTLPDSSVKPQKKLILAFSIILGLFTSLAWLYIRNIYSIYITRKP